MEVNGRTRGPSTEVKNLKRPFMSVRSRSQDPGYGTMQPPGQQKTPEAQVRCLVSL